MPQVFAAEIGQGSLAACFAVPATEIHLTKVVLTLLDGKPVWSDSTFAAP